MKRVVCVIASFLCIHLAVPAATLAQARAGGAQATRGLTPETEKRLQDSLKKAEAYLRSQQRPDATWENHPGITALAATALLRQPGVAKAKQLETVGRTLDALIQVNTSGEAQKGGVSPEAVADLLAAGAAWPNLRIRGLMAIPAASDDPERTRPAFAMLRALRDSLRGAHPELVDLSMGMSGDFEVAIEEGATLVRVGTALFGPRE